MSDYTRVSDDRVAAWADIQMEDRAESMLLGEFVYIARDLRDARAELAAVKAELAKLREEVDSFASWFVCLDGPSIPPEGITGRIAMGKSWDRLAALARPAPAPHPLDGARCYVHDSTLYRRVRIMDEPINVAVIDGEKWCSMTNTGPQDKVYREAWNDGVFVRHHEHCGCPSHVGDTDKCVAGCMALSWDDGPYVIRQTTDGWRLMRWRHGMAVRSLQGGPRRC
jgi:hypothetical protein